MQAESADALDDNVYIEEPIAFDNEAEGTEVTEGKRRLEPEVAKKSKKSAKKARRAKTKDPFAHVAIWNESPHAQHAYIHDRQLKAFPSLSAVELEEQFLPETALVDNTRFKEEHVLDALPKYVKFGVAGHKKLDKKPTTIGKPVALVLTHAALRATDLIRVLRTSFGEQAKIGKLFAKHLKVEEQAQFLRETPIHFGVGTPNRILALVEQGHLNLDGLELVVVDCERNPKGFTIYENDAVRADLFKFIGTFVLPRLASQNVKIGLF